MDYEKCDMQISLDHMTTEWTESVEEETKKCLAKIYKRKIPPSVACIQGFLATFMICLIF